MRDHLHKLQIKLGGYNDEEYQEFLVSELITPMMEDDEKSVRKLTGEVDLSPIVIQKLRSGKQEDVKLSNFLTIAHACGYHLALEKGGNRISL